jgi:PHD/YefM family antitoxin component YafN of YafNO toxin-antitoxin module
MLNVLDLRNRGIKAIDEEIKMQGIATLSYRGKPKYIILEMDEYEKLREMELMMALKGAMEDIKNGKVEVVKTNEDLNDHLKELKKTIKN